jgi:perosamine synthetase
MVVQTEPDVSAGALAADRSVETYRRAVLRSFAFLKQTERLDDLWAKSVALREGRGYLLPVCELHARDDALIALLARWREENAAAFPSRFPVTVAGTAAWLRSRVLEVEDRLLFLVLDRHGRPLGHLGLANAVNDDEALEVDNVVRGVKGASPGLMAEALRAMLDWVEEMFRPRRISLRVLSDNAHAIAFYRRLGFRDDALLPLRRHCDAIGESFRELEDGEPADDADAFFLRMIDSPRPAADATELIHTAGPSISMREVSYALDAVRRGWNDRWNVYIKRFESSFQEFLGAKHALSTSSGTGALHLAMAALGIGPGDEVIVPDLTWVASANAVAYVGATPVFIDVQPESWCLDPASFEAAITRRTKAVVPVHLYGHPADMDRVMAIARRHGLAVVEDAAPALGAECRGRRVGTFGDFAAFSFQGAKLLVTGEGGMLVTNDDELYDRAYDLWDQGRDPDRTFWINQTGLKYKLSNVQAAIGLGQLERVDELIEAKRAIFSWYAEGLGDLPQVTLNHEAPWARSIYWMSSLIIGADAGVTRERLRSKLRLRNIDTRPAFPAISQYPMWRRRQAPAPVALRIGATALNLPSGVRLKRGQVRSICRCIEEILARGPGDG